MMSVKEFEKYVDKMVEDFGVQSYLNNIDPNDIDSDDDESPWFQCPICGEPILYEDCDKEWTEYLHKHICPICEENFYDS